MAILKKCEIWHIRLDPKRPNSKYNKKNPTWELQIRTRDKEQKKAWEELNLPVKAVIPEGDDEKPYYRVNLRKKSIKKDGEPSSPVGVKDGALRDIGPNTIGNGSIANIRVFQYQYPKEDGTQGVASVLMGIQVTKHILYEAPPRQEDFEEEETEVVGGEDDSFVEDDENDDGDAPASPSPSVTKSPSPSVSKAEPESDDY